MPTIKLPSGSELNSEDIVNARFDQEGANSGTWVHGEGPTTIELDTLSINVRATVVSPDQISGPDARLVANELELAKITVFWNFKKPN